MVQQQETNFAQQLAKDAVDGLMKQAGKQAAAEVENTEAQIDDETKKKLIDREIKMAADPDFELAELAKRNASARLRQNLVNTSPQRVEQKTEAAPAKDKAELSQDIGKTAMTLLQMGLPWQAVSQYLNSSLAPQFPVAFGGGNQGLTLTDVLSLVDRMNANKSNTELTELLKTMQEEIRTLRHPAPAAPPIDPLEQIRQSVNLVKELRGALVAEEVPRVAGEPLEVVKEKNRHSEKLEEIKNDRDYKAKIAEAVADIPENLGKGLAGEAIIRQQAQNQQAPVASNSVRSFKCKNVDCGASIFVPPDMPAQFKCPKCGMLYGKTETPDEPPPAS